MNVKFQAEIKELDEKFAAIPEDAKRRYDRHRFIRRATMTYWSSTFVVFYVGVVFGVVFHRQRHRIAA